MSGARPLCETDQFAPRKNQQKGQHRSAALLNFGDRKILALRAGGCLWGRLNGRGSFCFAWRVCRRRRGIVRWRGRPTAVSASESEQAEGQQAELERQFHWELLMLENAGNSPAC